MCKVHHDIYPQSHHNVQDSWVWYSSVCVFIVPTVIMVTTLALIFFQFYKNPTQEKLMTRGTRTEASYHRRVALIMAVITVAFLVCWWPYAVIFMLGDRVPRIDTPNISKYIHIICLPALAPFAARFKHLGTTYYGYLL